MQCEYCGKEFERKSKRGAVPKYCSRECCRSADRDNKRIQYVGKREKVCRQCGKELPKNKTRFCSEDCKRRYNHIKSGLVSHEEILKKICLVCGKVFETWRSQQLTCSPKCYRVRRQRIKDNYGIVIDKGITKEKVAERDRNICQICGRPVDWNDYKYVRGYFVTGDNYPSIDHIIPKTKGGLHEWSNVQLTHYRCNVRKSNK